MQTSTAIDLSTLSDDSFKDIVNQDVRDTLDSATANLLRQPGNVGRWYDTLVSMKRTVEAQLAANRNELTQKQIEFLPRGNGGKILYLQQKAEIARWRQGAIRFKNGVEDSLAEAKRLRVENSRNTYVNTVLRERDHAVREALRLRQAILSHREQVDSDEDHAANADEELWQVIDSSLETE